jgi:hypothetical protein
MLIGEDLPDGVDTNNRDEKCIRAVGVDTNKGKKEGKVLELLVWTPTGEGEILI